MKSKKGFTLVELIVVITILSILGTIAFVSLQGFSRDARDSKRISDLRSIQKSLAFHRTKGNFYPLPENHVDITYSGSLAWSQGYFGKSLLPILGGITTVPTDPVTGKEYSYSVTAKRNEFQVAGVIEGDMIAQKTLIVPETYAAGTQSRAYITGDYNNQLLIVQESPSLSYILAIPSIINGDLTHVDVLQILQNQEFVSHLLENTPDAYNNTSFDTDGIVNFAPDSIIVWEGDLETLSTDLSEQMLFVSNLQDAYSGSILVNTNADIRKIVDLDVNSSMPSSDVLLLTSSILKNSLNLSPTIFQSEVAESNNNPYELPLDSLSEIFAQGSIFTKSWETNSCDPDITSIVALTPGTNQIPSSLPVNTIYLLADGDYINTSVTLTDCSAIIGEGDSVSIFSSSQLPYQFYVPHNRKNVILANMQIDGSSDSLGGTHSRNTSSFQLSGGQISLIDLKISDSNYAINTEKDNYLFTNIEAYNNNIAINMYEPAISEFENIQTYNNDNHGLVINGAQSNAQENTFTDVLAYNNGSRGLILNTSSGSMENINTYDNGAEGMILNISDMIVSNITSENNAGDGIAINGSRNSINNTLTQGNGGYGINMNSGISENNFSNTKVIGNAGTYALNVVGNSHSFQNLDMYDNISPITLRLSGDYHYINNVRIVNNTHSIYVSGEFSSVNNFLVSNNDSGIGHFPRNFFLNNGIIMNGPGLYTSSSSIYGIYTHNVSIANTTSRGASGNIEYFGYIHDISNPFSFLSSVVAGTGSTLGFSDGTLDSSIVYDASYAVSPNVVGWDTMLKRIQCETGCTNANLTGNFDENTSFTYGNNIATQAQPVKYNTISASFELYGSDGSDYESLKQVGQW